MIITGGLYKGRKITAPNEKITRPTLSKIRMGVFNTLYSIIGDFQGLSFLDLFGGSGIMGLEAFSRGFENVTVFEINKSAADIIKKNYLNLNIKPDLKIGDSTKLINNVADIYDVIYIDPPYESNIYEEILPTLIKRGKYIIVEHSSPQTFDPFYKIKEKSYGGKNVTFLYNAFL